MTFILGVQKVKKSNYKGNKSKFSFESQLKIIEEAKLTKNNTQVGRKYGISETCVRFWRKKEAEIRKKIFMNPDDDENDVVDLNENTGKKLPEKETKTQKTTLKILMKTDDSQTAVKEIILENSGDVSIGETIDRNNTYDESPSNVSKNPLPTLLKTNEFKVFINLHYYYSIFRTLSAVEI